MDVYDQEGMCVKTNRKRAAPFVWGVWLRTAFIFLLDSAVLVAGLCVIVFGVRYLHLQTAVDLIAKTAAWPALTGFLVILFRNPIAKILYEIPAFVARSSYGGEKDDMFSPAWEEEVRKKWLQDPGSNKQRAGILESIDKAMDELSKKYDCSIKRNVHIGNSKYVYDGIIRADGRIIAVEILMNINTAILERKYKELQIEWARLPAIYKNGFKVIFYVLDEDLTDEAKSKLLELARRKRGLRLQLEYRKTDGGAH